MEHNIPLQPHHVASDHMSVRAYIATQAMVGLTTAFAGDSHRKFMPEGALHYQESLSQHIANMAIELADTMIIELNKPLSCP